jgi:dephospho-CoA kinase
MKQFENLRHDFLEKEYLEEKQVIVGKGSNYNQIVFLAGGAGSGKGFAISNFMQGEKFKVRDVDEWKRLILKINDIKRSNQELLGLNLKDPKDVFTLHKHVEGMNLKDKTLELLLKGMSQGRLPNIIFDVTMKHTKHISDVIPSLLNAGYQPKDIHVIWVLTDYSVAVKQNKSRSRVVPDDILLSTHEGAAKTMLDYIDRGLPSGVDGAVHMILGGKDHTVFYTDEKGKEIKTSAGNLTVKDFEYVTIKKEGKPVLRDVKSGPGGAIQGDVLKQKIYKTIMKKIPRGKTLSQLMGNIKL